MSVSTPSEQDVARFTALFDTFRPRVLAYARRHVGRDATEDIVSETFLVAWRRLGTVPEEPLPWLLAVTRNVIANHRRKLARHDRLAVELAALDRMLPDGPSSDEGMVTRADLFAALSSLSALEREALLLTGWDGLSDAQAARVCGCSARTFRVRLHRARKRLERATKSQHEEEPVRERTSAEAAPFVLDQLLKESP